MSTDHDGYVGGRTVDPVNDITVNPKQYDVNCDEARGHVTTCWMLKTEKTLLASVHLAVHLFSVGRCLLLYALHQQASVSEEIRPVFSASHCAIECLILSVRLLSS